jgi:hypothetical protein
MPRNSLYWNKNTWIIFVLLNPEQGFSPYEKISHMQVPQAHISAVLLRWTNSNESYSSIGIQGNLNTKWLLKQKKNAKIMHYTHHRNTKVFLDLLISLGLSWKSATQPSNFGNGLYRERNLFLPVIEKKIVVFFSWKLQHFNINTK